MSQRKPHRACDIDKSKLKFPLIGMPKLDGVRGINLDGEFTARTLKPFKNKWVTQRYTGEHTIGFDGELCLGSITAPRLCSVTTGFVNRKTPKPKENKPTESEDLVWWIFDYVPAHLEDTPYILRLDMAEQLVAVLRASGDMTVNLVPWRMIDNLEELEAFDADCLEQGYEGSIYRNPDAPHKNGTASTKLGAYLRLKTFIDFEGEIVNLIEAMENANEAKTNELGRTERSSHQENLIPKGMIGMIQMKLLADVVHEGVTLFKKDMIVDVGPGAMTHEERIALWLAFINNTEENIVGKIGKAKFFPKGIKDKPRFPTFLSIRSEEDM